MRGKQLTKKSRANSPSHLIIAKYIGSIPQVSSAIMKFPYSAQRLVEANTFFSTKRTTPTKIPENVLLE